MFYKTKSNLFDKLIFIFYLINNLSIRFKLLYVILDMAQMAIIIILYFID